MEITIGLPVYNAEEYIEDCIKSILNQTYRSFKLLIIDDGSTDNSIAIIRQFKDPRIELIIDSVNKGLPARLNQIAQLCKTKYLVRMDSDDIMHVERIAIQISIMEQNPEIDVLGANAYIIDELNTVVGIYYNNKQQVKLRRVTRFVHPTIIAKTDWFLNNPYNEKVLRAEDGELWGRTKYSSIFKETNLPLLFYRETANSFYKKYWWNLRSKGHVLKSYFKFTTLSRFMKYLIIDYFKAVIMTFIYSIAAFFRLEKILLAIRSKKMNTDEHSTASKSLLKAIT